MRCKKHISDLSSSVGVCSTCLRERLFALIAAQAQAQAHAQAQQQAQLPRALSRGDQDPRKSDSNTLPHPSTNTAPALAFPRSVSPYVSRRKSDGAATWNHLNGPLEDHHHHRHPRHHHLRFYSTPQVGPTFSSSNPLADSIPYKKKRSKFSLFTNLFRSRSEKFESDPRVPYRDSYPVSSSSTTASPSWFSAIFSSRKSSTKPSPAQFFPEETLGTRRPRGRTDRGMSPADVPDFDYDYGDEGDQSPSGSGHSSESSPRWKRTPVVAPLSARRTKSGPGRNVSGLAFCLSPLVRASPNRHWNQKSLPPEIGKSGEGRVAGKPHLSTAASFCKNRSRKLVDFGRANPNR
ncbi:hypothetical protein CsatB_007163 [Cannabis sativa]|uniref:Uncharacterized protein n=2 Tax=Cannabis sativa TaxID=3483 RepID=A0AB40E7B6_CANSA|nr:uncharacterized protein LOC115710782 [Cannabis sativa]KAF4388181.1 hypothetical protein G4B88_021877 [Cannabis sativa]KAF4395260.1 hypothetical protein F8388_001647 [Cannabis sativa]